LLIWRPRRITGTS